MFDLGRISLSLDKFKKLRKVNEKLAKIYFLASLAKALTRRTFAVLWRSLPKFLAASLRPDIFTFSNFPKELLVLTFTVICNPYTFDSQDVPNCHPGEIRTDKIYNAAAIANLAR
jgi:hypothetical protein